MTIQFLSQILLVSLAYEVMSNTFCSKHRGLLKGVFALKVPKSLHIKVNRARPNSTVIVCFGLAAVTSLLNASTLPL